MSAPALAQAVRDALQSRLTFNGAGLTSSSCEIGFDGQPHPDAGELYLAVHSLGWSNASGDYDLEEEHQVAVTVTLRMGFGPKDRWGIGVWAAANNGLDVVARAVITALHQNQTVRVNANNGQSYSIGDLGPGLGGPDGFYTTVQFVGAQPPRIQGAQWFSATSDAADAPCGVSQELRFGKANRCQTISGMT